MNIVQFKKKSALSTSSNTSFDASLGQTSSEVIPSNFPAIGIDLGTTNSVVSVFKAGLPTPYTLKYEQENLVPSMLFWDEVNQQIVVGKNAKLAIEEFAAEVVKGTKRFMGGVETKFKSQNKSFTPEESASFVLKYMVSHPELQTELKEQKKLWAVVTVPAHFDDAARQATLAAAKSSGINVLRIINEPTSAALAYSMFPDITEVSKEIVAVFDFGGGTFDVSIVEREGLIFNVLSSDGDIYLGGDDIDKAFAEHLRQFVTPILTGKRASESSPLFQKLIYLAEKAKCDFQIQGEAIIEDNNLDGKGSAIKCTILRDEFEAICAPFIQRTIELTERAIRAARKRPKDISRILLVGGSTRLNLITKMLQMYFSECMVDSRLEPDLAVSWGAAIQAAIILGIKPDTILVDVCSHSLGIGVAEDSHGMENNYKKLAKKYGINPNLNESDLNKALGKKRHDFQRELQNTLQVAHIIQRNSPLPARKSEFFNTLYDNQPAVHVIVVQGESYKVGENRFLGAFFFNLQQPCAAGTRCEIQLTYDVNGMVHVLAKQIGTNNQAEAKFNSRTGHVIGWENIAKNEPSNSESEFESPDTNIVNLFGGRVNLEENKQNSTQNIVNSIIMRGKNLLKNAPINSDLCLQLARNIVRYSELLTLAQTQLIDDNEIEELEEMLLQLMEKIESGKE